MKDLIVFGGKSVEHDISIITGVQALNAIKTPARAVYIDKNNKWWICDNASDISIYHNFEKRAKNKKQVTFLLGTNELLVEKHGKFVPFEKVSAVLNCCHGGVGENGSLQGLCDICDIPQTSSSVVSMAISMDKAFMKDILKANDIPSASYVYFHKCQYENAKQNFLKKVAKLGYPVIVKPANLGSSIGISVCEDAEKLSVALSTAFSFDEKVLIEKVVQNLREFNCACFAYKGKYFLSTALEVKNKGKIYSFDDKYLSTDGKGQDAPAKLSKKIQTLTEEVYKKFDCHGIVRVDFLLDEKEGKLFVNELNTIPGSMAFYLFKGTKFSDILNAVLIEAKLQKEENLKLIKSFDSDAIEIFENAGTGKGAK